MKGRDQVFGHFVQFFLQNVQNFLRDTIAIVKPLVYSVPGGEYVLYVPDAYMYIEYPHPDPK